MIESPGNVAALASAALAYISFQGNIGLLASLGPFKGNIRDIRRAVSRLFWAILRLWITILAKREGPIKRGLVGANNGLYRAIGGYKAHKAPKAILAFS